MWSVPRYTLLSPGNLFPVSVDTIQLLLVLPEVAKPAGMLYHWERTALKDFILQKELVRCYFDAS